MDTSTSGSDPAPLSETEVAMLDFEARWWTFPGSKDAAIRDVLAMTSVRYYRLLTRLIERPEAAAHDPLLVKRLRRLRDRRTAERIQRRSS